MKHKVHEDVPYQIKKPTQEEIQARIRKSILPIVAGKDNAMISDKISRIIGITPGATNQPIRKAMKIILVEDGIPIVAGVNGFFVAKTVKEVDDYIDNMQQRITGLSRNIIALQSIKKDMGPKQLELF